MPTKNLLFYEIFKDLKGRRILAVSNNRDIQTQAFAHENEVYVMLNNLSSQRQKITLNLPPARAYSLRRLGRNKDFTPYMKTTELEVPYTLEMQGYETLALTARYATPVQEHVIVNEEPFYADATTVSITDGSEASFEIWVPSPETASYATLRVGFRKESKASREISAILNDKAIDLPVEGSSERYVQGNDYATTRTAPIDVNLLKANNRIRLSFPDNERGMIGSVVLRVARTVSP